MGVIPSGAGSASGVPVGSVNGVGAAVVPGVGEVVGVEMEAGAGGVSGLDVGAGVAPVASGPGVFPSNTSVATILLGVDVCVGPGTGIAAVQASVTARITGAVHGVNSFTMQSCSLAVAVGVPPP